MHVHETNELSRLPFLIVTLSDISFPVTEKYDNPISTIGTKLNLNNKNCSKQWMWQLIILFVCAGERSGQKQENEF